MAADWDRMAGEMVEGTQALIAKRVAPLEARLAALEARLAAVESKSLGNVDDACRQFVEGTR